MPETNGFTHLTLEERRIILTGITNGSTKTAIVKTIGKDKSTGKEIKQHRELTHKCHLPLECIHYKKCRYDRQCTAECLDYEPFKCSRASIQPPYGSEDLLHKCFMPTASQDGGLLHTVQGSSLFSPHYGFYMQQERKGAQQK